MDGRKALAKAFGAYVDDRGLTQTDVAAMGGPSTTTQSKIRRTNGPISRQTLKLIDDVTGWPPGTAAAILSGGLAPALPQPSEESQGDRFDGISDIALLAELGERLDRVARERSESHDRGQEQRPPAVLETAHATQLDGTPPLSEPAQQHTPAQQG